MRNVIAILGLLAICLSAFAQSGGDKQRAPATKAEERVILDCSWPKSDSAAYSVKNEKEPLGMPPQAIVLFWIPETRTTFEICRQSCGGWQIDRDEYRRRASWRDNKGYQTEVIDRATGVITVTHVAFDPDDGEVPVSVQGTCRPVHR